MIEIDYTSPRFGTVRQASPHRVLTKARWSQPWREAKGLYALDMTWSLSPGVGTATLHWKYGVGMLRGERGFSVRTPDTGDVRYVKIEVATTDGRDVIPWVGIVTGQTDNAGGRGIFDARGNPIASGFQSLPCVALEKVLDDTVIRSATWYDNEAGETFTLDRPITFNAPRADEKPRGNRSSVQPAGSYVFSGRVDGDGELWTTHTILEYLLAYHWPRDFKDTVRLPVSIDANSRLTLMLIKDKPVLDPTHRTLREVINQLLPPQRLLSWHLYVRDDAIYFRVVPLTADGLVFPDDGGMLLGAERDVAINYETGRDVRPLLVRSHHDEVDRVRLRGRRGIAVWSPKWSEENPAIDRGWKEEQEEKYELGDPSDDLADAPVEEHLRRNAAYRNRDELKTVYSRYVIPHDWNGSTPDGAVFPNVYDTPRYRAYPRELFLLPTLPLLDGYKYETEAGAAGVKIKRTEIAPGPHNELAPLAAFKDPDYDDPVRYVQADVLGMQAEQSGDGIDTASRRWSAHVQIPRYDRAIVLNVTGGPQHVIAGADHEVGGDGFFPLTIEAFNFQKPWHWRDAYFTVAAEMDCFCEGVYPPQLDAPGRDTIRELVVDAGDVYRLDRLHKGTVLGIKDDGSLDKLTESVWLNDDRTKLAVRAELAFAWYGVPRSSVRFSAPDIRTELQLGDFVRTITASGEPTTVNCTVTQIRLTLPVDGGSAPQIEYDTQFSLLDIGALL